MRSMPVRWVAALLGTVAALLCGQPSSVCAQQPAKLATFGEPAAVEKERPEAKALRPAIAVEPNDAPSAIMQTQGRGVPVNGAPAKRGVPGYQIMTYRTP